MQIDFQATLFFYGMAAFYFVKDYFFKVLGFDTKKQIASNFLFNNPLTAWITAKMAMIFFLILGTGFLIKGIFWPEKDNQYN